MAGNNIAPILTYLLLVLIGLTSGVGEILLYKGVKPLQPLLLLAAGGLWCVSLTLFGVLLRIEHFSFGAAVILATIVHLAIAIGWGLLFTGNKVSSLELAGLILAIIAVILLEAGRASS